MSAVAQVGGRRFDCEPLSLDARGGADIEQVALLPHGPHQEAAPFTGHRGSLCLTAPYPSASPPEETDRAAVVQN